MISDISAKKERKFRFNILSLNVSHLHWSIGFSSSLFSFVICFYCFVSFFEMLCLH